MYIVVRRVLQATHQTHVSMFLCWGFSFENSQPKFSCHPLSSPSALHCSHLHCFVLPPLPLPVDASMHPHLPPGVTPAPSQFYPISTRAKNPLQRGAAIPTLLFPPAPPPWARPRRSCIPSCPCFLQTRFVQTCSSKAPLAKKFYAVLFLNTSYTCGRFVSILSAPF